MRAKTRERVTKSRRERIVGDVEDEHPAQQARKRATDREKTSERSKPKRVNTERATTIKKEEGAATANKRRRVDG